MRGAFLPGMVAIAGLSLAATPATTTAHSPSVVRDLMRLGQLEEGLRQVQASLKEAPRDPRWLSLFGDLLFRQAKFEQADEVYHQALLEDPHFARAHWGLGRLAALHSRSAEARERFSTAFQNDPRDPDLILSFADFVQDAKGKAILYRNFLALANPNDTVRREDVAAKLAIAERIGQRPIARRISAAQAYHLKLSGFTPSAQSPKGLLIGARINGGNPLRLLLDTGASGVYLNARSVRRANLELLVESRIGGLGSAGTDSGHLALARMLEIGELQLENHPVQLMNLDWLPEADGVIGTDVFKDFLVRLDSQSRTLDLLPFSQESGVPPASTYRVSHYLLVQASANGQEGVFVLDTGASFSLVASQSRRDDSILEMRGIKGTLEGVRRGGPLRLTMGGTPWVDANAMSTDLTEMSRQTGVEISGILGYPLLKQSILTINYRDGTVAFAPR